MERTLTFLLLLSLAGLMPLAQGCRNATTVPEKEDAMEWKGQHCGQARPSSRVVRTAEEWQALWAEIGRPAPADLGERFAAAVFLGSRPTGGFGVRFHDPIQEGGRVKVRFETLVPKGFVTQAFTEPYAVRLYPKTGLPVDLLEASAP
ncbi:MAG: protease complex subunit PrcB family protein [Elusimicrobiota bacterium]|jgi:hypothetical protein